MATVYLNYSLRQDILKALSAPFNKQADELLAQARGMFNALDIYKELVGPKLYAQLEAIPREYFPPSTTFHAWMGAKDRPLIMQFTLSEPHAIPHGWTMSYGNKVPELPRTTPNYEKAQELLTRRAKLQSENSTLHETIKKLLEKCKTVQQVQAVWPAVINFLPRESLTLYHKTVERVTKKNIKELVGPLGDQITVSTSKALLLKDA